MLKKLLQINELRERSAAQEVIKRRKLLEEKIRLVHEAEQRLKDYVAWRILEENRLYDEIIGNMVHLTNLEDLKLKIGLLRQKDIELEQALQTAKQTREAAEAALEEAKRIHQEKLKAVEKYKDLCEQAKKTALTEQQYKEDAVLEEFLKPKGGFALAES